MLACLTPNLTMTPGKVSVSSLGHSLTGEGEGRVGSGSEVSRPRSHYSQALDARSATSTLHYTEIARSIFFFFFRKRWPIPPLFFSSLRDWISRNNPINLPKAEYAMQLELSFYWKMSKSYKYNPGSEIGREKGVRSPLYK